LANGSEAKKKPLTEGARGKRVISGMRPTGRLHIGHYFGALQNWVRLQNAMVPGGEVGAEMGRSSAAPLQRPEYECFYFIADWHALTSDYADTSAVAQNTLEIMIDYLATGLDPQKSVIFQQSQIPEHAELHLLLSMVTPLGWLERVPTYKEALENVKDKDLHTYGFLGYPCLQAADIVIYSEEDVLLVVPVGEDQVSHVEVTREIVRRFNTHFGLRIDSKLFREGKEDLAILWGDQFGKLLGGSRTASGDIDENWRRAHEQHLRAHVAEIGIQNFLDTIGKHQEGYFSFDNVLIEPEAMLTQTPRIPGLDGRKMSKSYGNTITLSESDADIRAKTKVMMTDPARKRRSDPGNPDVCPVYDWHKLFSPPETLKWSAEGCRTAGIGCIECKAAMADNLIKWIAPIRERRLHYQGQEKLVRRFIQEGSVQARIVAQQTMVRVRDAVFGKDRVRRRSLKPLRKHQAG
jgi:tryptophanyl-tRNA synthetase